MLTSRLQARARKIYRESLITCKEGVYLQSTTLGVYLTARLKQALHALPSHLIGRVNDLAERTGVSPTVILEESLRLYERQMLATAEVVVELQQKPELANLAADPCTPELISTVMSVLARMGNAQLSAEELSKRGRAGAMARSKGMDPKRRSAIARQAALARWKDKPASPDVDPKD